MQKINKEIHTYAAYLDGKKSLNVTHYGEIPDHVKYFSGKISSDLPVHLTIGTFEGGYTAIVNKNIEKQAVFSINFETEVEKLDVVKNKFVPLDTNNVQINPGDMILIRTK